MKINDGFKETEIGPLPKHWGVCRFQDAFVGTARVPKVKRSDYHHVGSVPVVDQGQNFIGGYVNTVKPYPCTRPVIVFGDHTRILKFIDFPFVAGGDGTKVLIPNYDRFYPRFLFYAISRLDLPNRGYNRHFHLLRELKFPFPPLSEQQAIAHVLRNIQRSKEASEQVIAFTRDLKKSFMHHLFTYGSIPPGVAARALLKETEIGEIPEKWALKQLGDKDVSEIVMGQSPPSSSYNISCEGLPFFQGNADFGVLYPTPRVYCTKPLKVSETGDILISVRAPVGEINISPFKCIIGRGLAAVRSSPDNTYGKFLYYYLKNSIDRLKESSKGSTFKAVGRNSLMKFKIALPPLSEQKRIVDILSTIDNKILIEERRKESFENLFKTMLNKLMTGQIRINQREKIQ